MASSDPAPAVPVCQSVTHVLNTKRYLCPETIPRGGWIAGIGSKGTRPALLPAGPVPERWNVKLVFIETPDGQRLAGRARSAYIFFDLFHLTRAEILYLVNNELLYGFRENQNPHYVKKGDHLQEIAKWIGM